MLYSGISTVVIFMDSVDYYCCYDVHLLAVLSSLTVPGGVFVPYIIWQYIEREYSLPVSSTHASTGDGFIAYLYWP